MLQEDVGPTRWVQRALRDDRRRPVHPLLIDGGSWNAAEGAAVASSLGLHWCPVPGATFALSGDGQGHGADQAVTVSAFEMTQVPITNAQYDRFVASGGYAKERYWTVYGWRQRRASHWDGPDRVDEPEPDPDAPVTGVSWWEAMAFACWVDAVLPSEAQWECAALQSGTPGDAVIDLRDPSPPRSPFGCLDLNAHIAEWCLDNATPDATAAEPLLDPVAESSETAPHVVRGGCGLHDAQARCGNSRDEYPPVFRDPLVGFRLVRSAPPVT